MMRNPTTPTIGLTDQDPTGATLRASIAASGRGWITASVATALTALLSTFHTAVPVGAGAAVAVLTVAALVDVSERRLPDGLVGAAALVLTTALIVEQHVAHTLAGVDAATLAIGSFVCAGPLLALHLISPASMGFGDVKAAIVLGAALATVDWQLSLVALTIGAGLSAAAGVALRAQTVAFGPGLVFASAVSLAAYGRLLPTSTP